MRRPRGGPRGGAVLTALLAALGARAPEPVGAQAKFAVDDWFGVRRGGPSTESSAPPALRRGAGPDRPQEFLVDDSVLGARSPGLAYRATPRWADWSGGVFAKWGSRVVGELADDGWVKTGNGYLPMEVNHHRVLVPVPATQDGIVVDVMPRTWWGFPSYGRYVDTGPQSWGELARAHGHLGNNCHADNALKQCTAAFVCKAGVCSQCRVSRDCSEKFRCEEFPPTGRRVCVPRELSRQWSWREGLCTFLMVITAMLSAAAGMGGGGVYVPLLLLLLELSTKEAVPLSQAMIMGGAVANLLMFGGERHPRCPDRPKIDYDVVMMLNPGLAAGVTVGVMLNIISPQWLIVSVLLITLVLALQKSLTKGLSQFAKESAALAAAGASAGSGKGGGDMKLKGVDLSGFAALAGSNRRPLGLIVGCWAVFLASNVVKAQRCSAGYWLQRAALLGSCLAFTVAGAQMLRKKGEGGGDSDGDGVLAWTPRTMWLYPLMSTVAGFLGGFLGIGGGMVMGPLLLELGMVPEASQATTAMFVFLSSSLATIQFVALGKAMPEYALWFTSWVVVATFVGQTIVDWVLRKWRRSSLIVLSVAAIIAGSLVMMTLVGAMDLAADLRHGADMGFAPRHLCRH